jgi:2-polyprenyl-3-methyl-5-hydroxy-6-metoxy-1,4-benzoquinol methylase
MTHPPEFGWREGPAYTAGYLRRVVEALLPRGSKGSRVLDLGCGNGWWAGMLLERGYRVVGVDASVRGIEIARKTYPGATFHLDVIDSGLLGRMGEGAFDLVFSSHLYSPQTWASLCFAALRPGGNLLCSTPYHGYAKNLALSLVGGWDRHLDPLSEGGHIKFFSARTLRLLLTSAGFERVAFRGAGRLPLLAKSLVAIATRPA